MSSYERSAHLARCVATLKQGYARHAEKKRARSIVCLTDTPVRLVEMKYASTVCRSTTLKGKPCTFKATCGAYCKKHSVSKRDVVLGKKISL